MIEGYKNTHIGPIPTSWDIKEFDEISSITRLAGYEYSQYWKEAIDGEITALRGYNVGKNKLLLHNVVKISEELSQKLIRSRLFKGDVVFPVVGTIGNAIVIEEDNKYHINQNIAKITPNKNLSPYYLVQYLISTICRNEINRFNATTSQPNVLVGSLRQFRIPFPPLPEQQKIAEILNTVDNKIEVIEHQITETQELKKGLMQRLLTKGIGNTEFKDSPLGKIPKSWDVVTINSIGQVVTGSTPKTTVNEFYADGIILWASPSDLTDVKYINTTKKRLTPLGFEQTRKLPPKSILVTCIGSTIGKIGMTNSWMSTNQQINSIVCSDLNDSEFYYYVIEQNSSYIKSMAGTQAVPLLNKTDFSSILVIKPTLNEQRRIGEILASIDEKIDVLCEKKTHYQELKQGLMQQLLTGKIRVKV